MDFYLPTPYEDTPEVMYDIQATLEQYILKSNRAVPIPEKTANIIARVSTLIVQKLIAFDYCGTSPMVILQDISETLNVLVALSELSGMKNIFVRTLAPVVFETITYPGIDGWCGREIIKKFNIIIQNSDKEMRHALIAENNLMHLCKLVDLLSVCGDYEYQLGIMECIFRMCSKQQIEEYSKDLIPEDENLLKAFLAINNETFYNDVRRFLNIVNEKTMGVYSVICEQVLLDGVSVSGPEEFNLKGLWVDFNIKLKSISWFVDASLSTSDSHELLLLPSESIKRIVTEIFDDVVKISLELVGEIITEMSHFQHTKQVVFIMRNTEKAKCLGTKILSQYYNVDSHFNDQSSAESILELRKGKKSLTSRIPCAAKQISSNLRENMLHPNLIELTSDEDENELSQLQQFLGAENLTEFINIDDSVSDVQMDSMQLLKSDLSQKKRNARYMPLINIPNRESASSNTSECSEDAIKNVPEDVQYGPLKSKSIDSTKFIDCNKTTTSLVSFGAKSFNMMMINNEEMKETESEYYTAELEPLPESPKIKNKDIKISKCTNYLPKYFESSNNNEDTKIIKISKPKEQTNKNIKKTKPCAAKLKNTASIRKKRKLEKVLTKAHWKIKFSKSSGVIENDSSSSSSSNISLVQHKSPKIAVVNTDIANWEMKFSRATKSDTSTSSNNESLKNTRIAKTAPLKELQNNETNKKGKYIFEKAVVNMSDFLKKPETEVEVENNDVPNFSETPDGLDNCVEESKAGDSSKKADVNSEAADYHSRKEVSETGEKFVLEMQHQFSKTVPEEQKAEVVNTILQSSQQFTKFQFPNEERKLEIDENILEVISQVSTEKILSDNHETDNDSEGSNLNQRHSRALHGDFKVDIENTKEDNMESTRNSCDWKEKVMAEILQGKKVPIVHISRERITKKLKLPKLKLPQNEKITKPTLETVKIEDEESSPIVVIKKQIGRKNKIVPIIDDDSETSADKQKELEAERAVKINETEPALSPVIVMARHKVQKHIDQKRSRELEANSFNIEEKHELHSKLQEEIAIGKRSVLPENREIVSFETTKSQPTSKFDVGANKDLWVQEKTISEEEEKQILNIESQGKDYFEEDRGVDDLNVTKTTTASNKRRKLFDPCDLSYMETLPEIVEEKSVKSIENKSELKSISKRSYSSKKKKNKADKKKHIPNDFVHCKYKTGKIIPHLDLDMLCAGIKKYLLELKMKQSKPKGTDRPLKRKRIKRNTWKLFDYKRKLQKVNIPIEEYALDVRSLQDGSSKAIPEEKRIKVLSNIVLPKETNLIAPLPTINETISEITQPSDFAVEKHNAITEAYPACADAHASASCDVSESLELTFSNCDQLTKQEYIWNWIAAGSDPMETTRIVSQSFTEICNIARDTLDRVRGPIPANVLAEYAILEQVDNFCGS